MAWTPTVHILEYEDGVQITTTVPANKLHYNRLKRILNRYLDPDGTNATIDTVAVYRTPLEGESVGTKFINATNIGYHGYVYFQVEERYISLDKQINGLTIQVSEKRGDVLFNFEGNCRNGVAEKIVGDKGHIKVRELTDFFVQKGFFNEGYNVLTGNHCKQFSKEIFDKIAAVSRYHWEEDEQILKLGVLASLAALSAVAIM